MKKLLFLAVLMVGVGCHFLVLNGAQVNEGPKKIEKTEEKKQEEVAVECSICLNQTENLRFILLLPCAHAFHRKCFLPWILGHGNNTCPNCRALVQDTHLMLGKYPFAQETLASVCFEGIQRDNFSVVKFAIEHHVDVNAVLGGLGFTFLYLAADKASPKIVSALLYAGADPNRCTKVGKRTPLHIALHKKRKEVVMELLKYGIKTDKTALQIIKECDYTDLLTSTGIAKQ